MHCHYDGIVTKNTLSTMTLKEFMAPVMHSSCRGRNVFHNSRQSVSIKYIHIFDTKSPSSVNVIRIYLEACTFLLGVHYSSFTFNQRNGHLVL